MPVFNIGFEGAEDVSARFVKAELSLVAADGLLLKRAGAIIADSTRERFVSGDQGRWADIKQESRRRRRQSPGTAPLVDTGALMAAATATSVGVEGSLYSLTSTGLVMGVEDEFEGARRHQLGFENEPARPFMEITSQDEADIFVMVNLFAAEIVRAL